MGKARDQSTSVPSYVKDAIQEPGLNIRGALLARDEHLALLEQGRGYAVVTPAKGTALAMGGTSYSDTAPALLLDIPAATKILPLGLKLRQGGTVAGGVITVLLTIDTKTRYSSGGTAIVPLPMRNDVAAASSACACYYNPTANALSRNMQLVGAIVTHDVATTPNTAQTRFDFPDAPGDFWPVLIGPASIVLYTFATVTQPSWHFFLTYLELASTT